MHALRQIAHSGAEGGGDADLLLEEMEEIGLRRDAAGRAAGDQPAAGLQRQQAAGPGIGADMLEHHLAALLAGEVRL